MPLTTDAIRGKRSAQRLCDAFAATGILGQTEMPEDILPPEIGKGSLEHILFITLTVSIDYQRSVFPHIIPHIPHCNPRPGALQSYRLHVNITPHSVGAGRPDPSHNPILQIRPTRTLPP
jgi:hypothetical protein